MKKIKLTEKDLTRIIQRVIKEDSSYTTGGACTIPDGYSYPNSGTSWAKRNDKIQGTQFYVMIRPESAAQEDERNADKGEDRKCDLLLKWEDGMTPINLGPIETRYDLLEKFENLFLDLSANPQDFNTLG